MSTEQIITELQKRVARLEKSQVGKLANDVEYAATLAIEMGLDATILEKSQRPEVLNARQRLAKRLREEKHWGYSRIAGVLNCTENAVQGWRKIFPNLPSFAPKTSK